MPKAGMFHPYHSTPLRCSDGQTNEQKGYLPPDGWKPNSRKFCPSLKGNSGNKEQEARSKYFIGHDDQKMMVNTHTLRPHPTCCRAEATPPGPPPFPWALLPHPAATAPPRTPPFTWYGYCPTCSFPQHGAWTFTVKKSQVLDLSLRWAGLQCP